MRICLGCGASGDDAQCEPGCMGAPQCPEHPGRISVCTLDGAIDCLDCGWGWMPQERVSRAIMAAWGFTIERDTHAEWRELNEEA